MSSADRPGPIAVSAKWLRTRPRRYGFALVAVCAAVAVQRGLEFEIGFAHSFLPFYPTILIVSLLSGFLPGVAATLLCACAAAYFYAAPLNTLIVSDETERVGLALFVLVGIAISWLADSVRRRTSRLQEFEKAVEGLEEMIVVVDRNYRYLIANRAFLNYRGMKREDLIGRHIQEILNPGVFEATIKDKLDECFRGKIVQFEMRYRYPNRGERDLVISYFPIEGPAGIDRVASVLRDVTKQKQADHALRLFRALIDQSNDAVEVIDPDTLRFIDVNDKACKDLGYTREELLAMTVFDIDPSGQEFCSTAGLEKLRASGSIVRESVHKKKDGSTFPVEISVKFVQLEQRSYFVTVSRDITDRKRSEGALRESEDRYRDLVEHSEDLVCTHDLNGTLLSVNPAPARLLGYEVEELLSTPMRDLIAPEFREQFARYLNRISTNGSDRGFLCVLARDGQRRIWEYQNSLRTEGVDSPVVRGIAHDVTERHLAAEALRKSEERYRMLFEKTVAGVAIISMAGKVIDCNDAWARMFGHTAAADCRGSQVQNCYRDPAQREQLLAELCQSGVFINREWELLRKDGTPFWVLLNSTLIGEGQGEPLIQSTMFDITEGKRAETALRRSEESYRNFVAQSSEGIFRQDVDAPIPIDLPEEELVRRILNDSYMAECNDAIVKMYGLNSVQEFLGRRLIEFVDPNDLSNLELTRQYIRSGFRVVDRESFEADVHGNPKVFRNSMIGIVEDGKLVRTWGIQRDVTEQVKLEESRTAAETALRKSAEHFQLLVEQASDGIFLADREGRYVDVNSAGASMLGYTHEEVIQRSIADILAPGESQRLHCEIARYEGGAVTTSEWKFRRKDGSFFTGEVCGRRLPDGRLQGILRDISERKKAQETLGRSEERFRVALKDSPITVFNQDRDLRYTWIYNPQLYWQHDVLGKTDDEIIGSKKAAVLNELKRRVLATGIGLREEVAIPENGTSQSFDVTVEPLFDTQKNVVGLPRPAWTSRACAKWPTACRSPETG